MKSMEDATWETQRFRCTRVESWHVDKPCSSAEMNSTRGQPVEVRFRRQLDGFVDVSPVGRRHPNNNIALATRFESDASDLAPGIKSAKPMKLVSTGIGATADAADSGLASSTFPAVDLSRQSTLAISGANLGTGLRQKQNTASDQYARSSKHKRK